MRTTSPLRHFATSCAKLVKSSIPRPARSKSLHFALIDNSPQLQANMAPQILRPQPSFASWSTYHHDGVPLGTISSIDTRASKALSAGSAAHLIKHRHALSPSDFFLDEETPLPAKKYPRILRHTRYTFLNVYRRLFSVVSLLNVAGLVILFLTEHEVESRPAFLSALATAAAANIMVALLIRQDYVINTLFK